MPPSPDIGRPPAAVDRRLELVAAVMLASATVLSAWSSYQAHRWGGVQLLALGRSAADRTESANQANLANHLTQIDVGMFLQYVAAYARGDAQQLSFVEGRFRPEMKAAVTAWLTTRPLENPSAPKTPFTMPEYRLEARASAENLAALADRELSDAAVYNQHGDAYVLLTVLFASVLFFVGMSTTVAFRPLRLLALSMGLVLLLGGAVSLARLPVH